VARPKTPNAWKIISGSTPRRARPPEGVQIAPLEAPPPPPEWLINPAATDEWHRLVGLLTANRMLAALDIGTLAHLCAVHGQLVACHLAGIAPKASLVGVYASLSAAFGLTPATRSKVAPSSASTKVNRFRRFTCDGIPPRE